MSHGNKNPAGHDPDRRAQSGEQATPKGNYEVGYGRPPAHSRFQPGQSGNPRGRPKGRRNLNTELREVMTQKFTMRSGDTVHSLSLPAAAAFKHGEKAAKGDARSASIVLNLADKIGMFDQDDEKEASSLTDASSTTPVERRPSDWLFENLQLDLLTRKEKAELARFAGIIDLGGDTFALNEADLLRAKAIVDKGRGKDITPSK
jgi:hypothetical protein